MKIMSRTSRCKVCTIPIIIIVTFIIFNLSSLIRQGITSSNHNYYDQTIIMISSSSSSLLSSSSNNNDRNKQQKQTKQQEDITKRNKKHDDVNNDNKNEEENEVLQKTDNEEMEEKEENDDDNDDDDVVEGVDNNQKAYDDDEEVDVDDDDKEEEGLYDTNIDHDNYDNTNNSNNNTIIGLTLLYPPGLIDGYRNQVIRFIAFIYYAIIENNYTTIYMPLLSTEIKKEYNNDTTTTKWHPIPYDWIFDIKIWNQYNIYGLPKMIYHNHNNNDNNNNNNCWIHFNFTLNNNSNNKTNNDVDIMNDDKSKQQKSLLTLLKQPSRCVPPTMIHINDINMTIILHESIYNNITFNYHYPITIHTTNTYNTTTPYQTTINHLQYAGLIHGTYRALIDNAISDYNMDSIITNVYISLLTNQVKLYNPRKVDFYNHIIKQKHYIEHNCSDVMPTYGSGKGAGRFWNTYMSKIEPLIKRQRQQQSQSSQQQQQQQQQQLSSQHQLSLQQSQQTQQLSKEQSSSEQQQHHESQSPSSSSLSSLTTQLLFDEKWIYRALRPAKIWRKVAYQCIREHMNNNHYNHNHNIHSYIALHARIEMDMIGHKCGRNMEHNLTKIIESIYKTFIVQVSKNNNDSTTSSSHHHPNINYTSSLFGLFIAVSRDGMLPNNTYYNINKKHRAIGQDNVIAFNHFITKRNISSTSLSLLYDNTLYDNIQQNLPIFQCGSRILEKYYKEHPYIPNHGTLLDAVIDFYIAVQSHIFIGVHGSSFSNDVMTTRYYMKPINANNYRYTNYGTIEPVENNGLPNPHKNCRRRRRRRHT